MSFLKEFRNVYCSQGNTINPTKEAIYKEMEVGSIEIEHLKKIRDSIKI